MELDLESIPDRRCEKGCPGYSRHAMICASIVMKCEYFSHFTELVEYLNNNLLYYCGFNIVKKLPEYHAFEHFIKNFDHSLLKKLMASQVIKLYDMGIVDASFIAN